jgi:WD40 repeat protein
MSFFFCCAGADDAKVKLYQLSSGFCYVTFSEHSAPVTALAFLPTGAAVVSASLDGTVRAFDLLRYRCDSSSMVWCERMVVACASHGSVEWCEAHWGCCSA